MRTARCSTCIRSTALAEELAPRQGAVLSQLWRTKQLEYTWLSSLMLRPAYRREDFSTLTAHALDYAVSQLMVPLAAADRQRLLDAYRRAAPFPDATDALAALAPRPRLILSNGTLDMLEPLVSDIVARAAHRRPAVGRRGRHLQAFARACTSWPSTGCSSRRPTSRFVSSNGWDAAGAKAFGFTTFWINRYGLPVERHAPEPDYVVGSLAHVATLAVMASRDIVRQATVRDGRIALTSALAAALSPGSGRRRRESPRSRPAAESCADTRARSAATAPAA